MAETETETQAPSYGRPREFDPTRRVYIQPRSRAQAVSLGALYDAKRRQYYVHADVALRNPRKVAALMPVQPFSANPSMRRRSDGFVCPACGNPMRDPKITQHRRCPQP